MTKLCIFCEHWKRDYSDSYYRELGSYEEYCEVTDWEASFDDCWDLPKWRKVIKQAEICEHFKLAYDMEGKDTTDERELRDE
jgi:hypothetical protein